MRVIAAGSRYQEDETFVFGVLDTIHKSTPITCLIEGDATGTDQLCGAWADARGIEHKRYPANWDKWGRSAGPRRNSDMLLEKPNAVIAFPGGSGTRDMREKAIRAGIEVIEVRRSS